MHTHYGFRKRFALGLGGLLGAIILSLPAVESLQASAADRPMLVKDGQARAQIVVAENPPRLVALAVDELQAYLEKISGARLPVVHAPGADYPVSIHVGPSRFTEDLGIRVNDLKPGDYRMVSGPESLVLIGNDLHFEPVIPELLGMRPAERSRAMEAWDELTADLTKGAWSNPYGRLWRDHNDNIGLWHHDDGGTLNAVYGFLRSLGVRWFLPGALGEVVPETASIPLPQIDETVEADFAVRRFYGPAYFVQSLDEALWTRRLGMNHGYPVLNTHAHVHGLIRVHGRDGMKEAHPEYYAIISGEPFLQGAGHVCFSSAAFTRETIQYARAVFDLLDEPTVDLWPNDGIRVCECDTCAGQSAADLHFAFVERVARELYQTHPDRRVTSGAYSVYRFPPDSVETFSPNVGITIAFPRPGLDQPETWSSKAGGGSYDELMNGWRAKVASGWIMGNSNHRGGGVLMPRSIAADLRSRPESVGDWNEVGHRSGGPHESIGRETGRQAYVLGLHHLNMYVNAKLLWDLDQDLDALLDDYYARYYGPVAADVKAAFEFAEASYTRGQGRARLPLDAYIQLIERLLAAQEKAGDTVYARRLAYVMEDEPSLQRLQTRQREAEEAARARLEAPVVTARRLSDPQAPPTYSMVDLATGETPEIPTTFQVAWDADLMIVDIHCKEPDMENLFVSSDIWSGDSVAILIETPYHSYYQIEVNPDGAFVDLDRDHGQIIMDWSAQATVETERGEDYWRVRVTLPIVDEGEGALDPLHNVIGEIPTEDAPWFIQVGRVRFRDFRKVDAYAFRHTGGTYHNRNRFARLILAEPE